MKFGHPADFIFFGLFLTILLLPLFIDWWKGDEVHRWPRYALWFLACLSLAGLYLKPSITTRPKSQKCILLTDGYRQQDLDSLILTGDYLVTEHLADILSPEIVVDQLMLLGSGLDPWELDLIETHQFHYFPSLLKEGILTVNSTEAFANQPFFVSGTLNVHDSLKLEIHSPIGFEKEVTIAPTQSNFRLEMISKAAGNFVYSFYATRNNDTLFQEKLPIIVKKPEKASVLVVGAYPTFEVNYLKNYLQNQGYEILSKFSVSRDITQLGFGNKDKQRIGQITESLIDKVNCLIIDEKSYSGLSRNEKQLIEQKVKLGECGIFLMLQEAKILQSFGEIILKSTQDQIEISFQEDRAKIGRIPFEIASGAWTPIQINSSQIGGLRPFGIGYIGFGWLTDTYQLQLSGKTQLYANVWNELLNPIIGQSMHSSKPDLPTFAFVGKRTKIGFSSVTPSPVIIDEIEWPIINSPIRPEKWKVEFWPNKSGWNKVKIPDDSLDYHLFVLEKKDWLTKQIFEKQRYQAMYQPRKPSLSPDPYNKDVSKWIFFILFLISTGIMWVEQKLR